MIDITTLFIAIGLAMDAFAVSLSFGFFIKNEKKEQIIFHSIKIGLFFGLFQMIMPIAGFNIGDLIGLIVIEITQLIAAGLLFIIGFKMIVDSFKKRNDSLIFTPNKIYMLTILSITTSIDAFTVGISYALLQIPIIIPAITIGMITFIISIFGVIIGKKSEHLFKDKAKIMGGLILILIGFKILFMH